MKNIKPKNYCITFPGWAGEIVGPFKTVTAAEAHAVKSYNFTSVGWRITPMKTPSE